MRGYAYQSLGVTEGSAIVGGRYLAVTSAEYVHWYEGNWGIAAFVDAGNANDQRELFKMNFGYGFGPVGAARQVRSPWIWHTARAIIVRLQFAVAIAF
ncbi:MAG: BamA/TamA family outer membrane protein [Zoogloea sp.]|nr:BamA/TamA family outer membrane protein [Zoogloea sp.]